MLPEEYKIFSKNVVTVIAMVTITWPIFGFKLLEKDNVWLFFILLNVFNFLYFQFT
jgi:hypothetical protein